MPQNPDIDYAHDCDSCAHGGCPGGCFSEGPAPDEDTCPDFRPVS